MFFWSHYLLRLGLAYAGTNADYVVEVLSTPLAEGSSNLEVRTSVAFSVEFVLS